MNRRQLLAATVSLLALGGGHDGGWSAAASSERPGGTASLVAQSLNPAGGARTSQVQKEQIRAEGKAFLADNAKKAGIAVLPSGVQYRVVFDGNGATPAAGDTVELRYEGRLIDGTVFGSSGPGEKSEKFPVNRLVPGLAEALGHMKVGSRWTVFIPAALGFGERGPLEERVVIYDVTLLGVEGKTSTP